MSWQRYPHLQQGFNQENDYRSKLNAPIAVRAINLYQPSVADKYCHPSLRNQQTSFYQATALSAFGSAELYQLHTQASSHIVQLLNQKRVDWNEETVLSRVEPYAYYNAILNHSQHPGIEWPYIKNSNGHAESPINRKIYGLFMGAGSN
uniref:Uncharacterized protein n=1 Tax=Plectus sambesii TaxID=2011161 RepID=A0A914WKL7_9BILA